MKLLNEYYYFSALAGLDHKTHILLNKADQFTKMHDFARSYGSLCWNLSKVIGRKDLPRIYTMCVPHKDEQGKEEGEESEGVRTSRRRFHIIINISEYFTNLMLYLIEYNFLQEGAGKQGTQQRAGSLSSEMLLDLKESRDSVVREVFKAPERRLDNTITGLFESARTLRLHTSMTEKVRKYQKFIIHRIKVTGFSSYFMLV